MAALKVIRCPVLPTSAALSWQCRCLCMHRGLVDADACTALRQDQEDQRAIMQGASGINQRGTGDAAMAGLTPGAAEMSSSRLKELLRRAVKLSPHQLHGVWGWHAGLHCILMWFQVPSDVWPIGVGANAIPSGS